MSNYNNNKNQIRGREHICGQGEVLVICGQGGDTLSVNKYTLYGLEFELYEFE